jgi:hypothetical protein
MALTYAQLETAIQQYTQNTESTFIDNIPNFVQNTETLINNTVQLPAFRKNVTGQTTADFQYVDIPSDFLAVFSLAVASYAVDGVSIIGPYEYLLQKDVNYIREAYPYPSTPPASASGQPRYYSIFSNTAFLLGPTPDICYPLEMHYYAYPPSITVAGTSWLGNNYPSVLLWGSLVEAYIYMKGEADMIQTYQQKYNEAMEPLKMLGDGKDRQDNFRTTQVRDAVK